MSENLNNAPMEEEDGIIELEDENGEVTRFVLVAPVEYEDEMYLALMPEDQANDDSDEDAEIVLLHVEEDENGEEIYSSVDDDETADAVFEAFLKLMDEEAE